MAFWGGMGGGPGGWGGPRGGPLDRSQAPAGHQGLRRDHAAPDAGGPGGWGGPGGGPMNRWQPPAGQQGLRRSVDAWDDEELGSAYNHEVTMRLMSYVTPYKLRAVIAILGVVFGAVLLNYQPAIIGS